MKTGITNSLKILDRQGYVFGLNIQSYWPSQRTVVSYLVSTEGGSLGRSQFGHGCFLWGQETGSTVRKESECWSSLKQPRGSRLSTTKWNVLLGKGGKRGTREEGKERKREKGGGGGVPASRASWHLVAARISR